MNVGVPREIKPDEYRVALTPVGAEMLAAAGHEVFVEAGSGEGSGFRDRDYRRHGATIIPQAASLWERANLIVKVKEPQPEEIEHIRPGQIVFTYLHLAASRELTDKLLQTCATCIAYETVRDERGRLPLLEPMSEIAGKMAVQEAVKYLEKSTGGRGILIGGVPGTPRGHVTVLGAGTVGSMAARVAAGVGATVSLLDIDLYRLRHLAEVMPPNVEMLHSNPQSIREQLPRADVVIGAVLITGGRAPTLVRREDLKLMKTGAVIVDVAVDQGGCVETTRPTTHHDPIYLVDGIVHYGVANMPGAVSRTSTIALTQATLPYVLALANNPAEAIASDPGLAQGVNIKDGKVACPRVAEAFGLPYEKPRER